MAGSSTDDIQIGTAGALHTAEYTLYQKPMAEKLQVCMWCPLWHLGRIKSGRLPEREALGLWMGTSIITQQLFRARNGMISDLSTYLSMQTAGELNQEDKVFPAC